MKSANAFFTPEEQQKIEAAVKAAEATTSGEIVPMVVDSSYEYPRAELIGGGTLALATGLTVSWAVGGASIWWFLPIFIVGFFVFQLLISNWPALKRRLIHPQEISEEVREKALVCFLEQGAARDARQNRNPDPDLPVRAARPGSGRQRHQREGPAAGLGRGRRHHYCRTEKRHSLRRGLPGRRQMR